VAVKVFRLDITPEQAAGFASQLATLTRIILAHPSIVVPFDAGIEGASAYLATDYVAAESLDAVIRQYGPAPVSQAMRILASVAGALDFAAAVGVHHGALHPRDLLVTPDNTRVTGVGIGRALETIGLRAPMRRPYVAPERVQRESWDARADLYSLGVLARELLVGRPSRESAGEPRLPDEQAARLQPVLAKATSARAADRFPSSLDLIAALQEALASARTRPAVVAAVPGEADSDPRRAEKGRQSAHELLLPLEGEETGEDEAAPGGAVRLRLDDDDGLPDLAPAADLAIPTARAAGAFPDLDLDARAADREQPADGIDLSDLDSQLAPDLRPFGEEDDSRADAGPPAPMEVAGIGAGPTIPPSASSASSQEHAVPDGDVFEARLEAPREPGTFERHPSRAVMMLVVGLVLGAIGGYLVGVNRISRQARSAPTSASQVVGPAVATPATGAPQSSMSAAGTSGGPSSAAPVAAAPAAATGVLVVRSTPRGAAVTIDGRRRGVTPLRLRNLAPGRYTVRVSRRGYATAEREVVLPADRPSPSATVTFPLQRAGRTPPASGTDAATSTPAFYGSLSVDSLPSGARVFVDGRLVGTTPMVAPRVAAGSHVVRVDRTGFLPWTAPVQVVSGQRLRVTASLERESK